MVCIFALDKHIVWMLIDFHWICHTESGADQFLQATFQTMAFITDIYAVPGNDIRVINNCYSDLTLRLDTVSTIISSMTIRSFSWIFDM